MKNIRKDGPYSCFYLTATAIVSFTFIGLVDTIGVIVAVFIDHLNGSNAKGGKNLQNVFRCYIVKYLLLFGNDLFMFRPNIMCEQVIIYIIVT